MSIFQQVLKAFALVILPINMTMAMQDDNVPQEDTKDSNKSETQISFSLQDVIKKELENIKTPVKQTLAPSQKKNEEFFKNKMNSSGLSSDDESRKYDIHNIRLHAEKAMQCNNNSGLQKDLGKHDLYQLIAQLCESHDYNKPSWLIINNKHPFIKTMGTKMGKWDEDMVGQIESYVSSNAIEKDDSVVDILPKALEYIKNKLNQNK